MGPRPDRASVARAVLGLALVSAADAAEDTDLTVRMLSMGRFHPAVPVTGSVALTLAATVPGTVVHDLDAQRAGVPDGLGGSAPRRAA